MSNIPATMTEQVEVAKELEISYRTLHPCIIIKNARDGRNIQVPFSSIINKYKDFLSTIIVSVDLIEEDQQRFAYKPKLVSEELYGTPELWAEILLLNNAVSVKDFTPKVIYAYDPNRFKSFINEIMLLEDDIENKF